MHDVRHPLPQRVVERVCGDDLHWDALDDLRHSRAGRGDCHPDLVSRCLELPRQSRDVDLGAADRAWQVGERQQENAH